MSKLIVAVCLALYVTAVMSLSHGMSRFDYSMDDFLNERMARVALKDPAAAMVADDTITNCLKLAEETAAALYFMNVDVNAHIHNFFVTIGKGTDKDRLTKFAKGLEKHAISMKGHNAKHKEFIECLGQVDKKFKEEEERLKALKAANAGK